MNHRSDDELRGLFHELREREQRSVPAFESLLRRTQRTPKQPARPRLLWFGGLAAAAAIAIVFAVQSQVPGATASRISEWRAPTDVLLPGGSTEWLSEIPDLSASVLPAPTRDLN